MTVVLWMTLSITGGGLVLAVLVGFMSILVGLMGVLVGLMGVLVGLMGVLVGLMGILLLTVLCSRSS